MLVMVGKATNETLSSWGCMFSVFSIKTLYLIHMNLLIICYPVIYVIQHFM